MSTRATADPGTPAASAALRVAAVRRFSRFYTRRIGALAQGLYASPFSLTEARVLYELAQRDGPTASQLGHELDLDAGYLSRLVARFRRDGLVGRTPSASDGRRRHLTLSARGRRAFATLDARSQAQASALLASLSAAGQARLVGAMAEIERLLDTRVRGAAGAYVLRPLHAGDLGWVIGRHGAIYAEEYGWDQGFEALVAEIGARFTRRLDPRRDRAWIAERNGENLGCVFLVEHSRTVAQLRLLLVEPSARGQGIGRRLVDECVRFARQAGYRKITLWTQSLLHAARQLYREAGFKRVARQPHVSFGARLVSETWELALKPPRGVRHNRRHGHGGRGRDDR